VLCLHDFVAEEENALPFRRNEILEVVKKEGTGWWAAMRRGGSVVGWIPEAFVKPLTAQMARRLREIREELRVYEFQAEQLYSAASSSSLGLIDSTGPSNPPAYWQNNPPVCLLVSMPVLLFSSRLILVTLEPETVVIPIYSPHRVARGSKWSFSGRSQREFAPCASARLLSLSYEKPAPTAAITHHAYAPSPSTISPALL
jgi:hypothetical protein